MSGILDGKRILVAGVTMDSSIGFAAAKYAQEPVSYTHLTLPTNREV